MKQKAESVATLSLPMRGPGAAAGGARWRSARGVPGDFDLFEFSCVSRLAGGEQKGGESSKEHARLFSFLRAAGGAGGRPRSNLIYTFLVLGQSRV